ncbi:KPN_02809 family neutral zinc metallopeptidase [Rubellimicrobium aerolatum]|uniref:Neutral zinc metallopeptidase n=1 Tax=Rubellimicrobium aerolatum TaxID=490979 RepID=A0ABW0S8C7_9RHOB|nr:neutral zinc metallopeptidase [Rubellimicrobium aerolatum]MBP1804278.1 putative metalloprotease [Rubellimicrobium aerolatum]
MKWQGRRGSSNIEDRRRMGGGGAAIGGAGGVGVLAIVLIGYFLGVDLTPLLNGGAGGTIQSGPVEITEADEQAAQFAKVTLADTEEVWAGIFRDQLGQEYQPTTLVLFKGAVQSGCGGASAQTGPFYCPADQRVYLDTDFFLLMDRQLGAGGDFAAAYVVAHEVGHHVQDLLGILSEAQRGRQQGADSAAVRVELQADCFAGVWAYFAQNQLGTLEQGDIEEALNAAERIGDDTLQREAGQAVRPDSFTHGTSEQRERWFYIGFRSGDIGQCDTFRATTL